MNFARKLENARRIAYVLERYNDSEKVVKALAHYLNYEPEQLKMDMRCLAELVDEFNNSDED